jgi:hypothetical protein
MKKSFWFTLKRWGEIGTYAIVGVVALQFWANFVPEAFRQLLAREDAFWATTLTGALALIYLNWLAGFRFEHVRTVLRYPSFLLAALIVVIIEDYSHRTGTTISPFLFVPYVGFLTAVYVLTLSLTGLIRLVVEFSFNLKKPSVEFEALDRLSADAIIRWAQREEPLDNPKFDMFQFDSKLERIIEFLRAKERNTVAIVGDYGSGKTTLARFVRERVKEDGTQAFVFVSVSCWGFENAPAAQQAVLTQIIQSLSEIADCFGIQGMPAEFVEAISGTSDNLKSIFRLVASKDPGAQLDRISPILSALNTKLVVVIEDTERPSLGFDLSSIEGLLNRFRDIPEVAFIILASLDAKIDFARLCEHTELIPDLDPESVIQFLNIVRDFNRNQFQKDIDPVKRESLRDLFMFRRMDRYGFWESNLAFLINTPRKLKATIRRFSDAWKLLHGEVDIDELLIASCLRTCAPGAFSFLMRRNREFRMLRRDSQNKQDGPDVYLLNLQKEWEGLKGQGFDTLAAANLLQVLDSDAQALFDQKAYRNTNSPQEFRSERTTKYRDRILNERLSGKGVSDQEVLLEIVRAKDNGDWVRVVSRAEKSAEFLELCDMFFSFMLGSKLTRGELWRFVRSGFELLREKYGSRANQDLEMFSFLVRWGQKTFEDVSDYYEVMYGAFNACIPTSLELGLDIFHFLIVSHGDSKRIGECGNRGMDLFKKTFVKGRPEILINAFDDSNPGILLKLLKYTDLPNPGAVTDWLKWQWFGPSLYEALKKNFERMAPQITLALGLPLTGDSLPQGFLLNETVLNAIFGDLAKSVMLELARPLVPCAAIIDQPGLDFSLTHIRASEWLNRQNQ